MSKSIKDFKYLKDYWLNNGEIDESVIDVRQKRYEHL
jgi:hypothetical protein